MNGTALDERQRIEIRSRLDKPNVLGAGLSSGDLGRLRAATEAHYDRMEPAHHALQRYRDNLQRLVRNGVLTERESADLAAIARESMSLYLNPEQYHNAEHILVVTSDAIELAESAGGRFTLTQRTLRQLILGCLYHDAGNGAYPDIPGRDETQSIEIFLEDLKRAKAAVLHRESPGRLAGLADLSRTDVVAISGIILGTVFRDRHARVDQLTNLPEDMNHLQYDYIESAVELLDRFGYKVTKKELAESFVAPLALLAKDADIIGSLKEENVLKNGITNYHEDTQRDPGLYRGQDAARYRSGFIAFLRGDFHRFTHGDAITPAQKKTQRGAYLLGNEAIRELGVELTETSDQAFEQFLEHDREILDAIHGLISDAHDPALAERENIVDTTLEELGPRLRDRMGWSENDFDQAYGPAFRKYATKTIAHMLPSEINEVFGARAAAAGWRAGSNGRA